MSTRLELLALVLIPLLLAGCPNTTWSGSGASDGLAVAETESTETGADADTNEDATATDDDDHATGDGSDETGEDEATTSSGSGLSIGGRIDPGQAAKRRPRAQTAEEFPYTVIAQSDATGTLYRGETNADGDFKIEIPDDEAGHSFVVTILGPDGRAVGPILIEQKGDQGVTGLALEKEAKFGTIELPADPATAPILMGADGDADGQADPALFARLNADGAPLGLAHFGKGEDAQAAGAVESTVDGDKDGLIDILDADDDGDGIVDDFDTESDASSKPSDYRVNFFMNLKINAENASTYYDGAATDVVSRLATDTVITFEVLIEPSATRAITDAHLLETPGPAYLPIATKQNSPSGTGLWKDFGYAFDERSDRWDAFAVPNEEMQAGDTFTLEVSFSDGTTEQYSRMINYVFKNIPKLMQYGTSGSLTAFDVNSTSINGTSSQPILIDTTQDLVLVFEPPPDETGAPIESMDYSFQFFYMDSSGAQIQNIDSHATWPTPIAGHDQTTYWVRSADLGSLATDSTYTVTLPKELFVATVTQTDGTPVAVNQFKIDITAESPTGNAAIMLVFSQ